MLDDVLESTVKYYDNLNNSEFVTVLHSKVIIANDDANMEVFAGNALKDFVTQSVMPKLNAAITFTSVLTQRIRPLPRTAGYYLSGLGALGGVAGDMLPPQCALVIRKLTTFAGRQYRGRVFQPGFSEGDQNHGLWAGGGNAQFCSDAWGAFLTTPILSGGGSELVWIVCDRYGLEPTSPIVSHRYDPIVRTQRRRVRNVGS